MDVETMEQEDNKRIELALSVSKADFVDYFTNFEAEFGELSCPLCKNTTWFISSRDEESALPTILTIPLPFSPGRGMWVFPLTCNKCGFVVTFDTNFVTSKIKGSI